MGEVNIGNLITLLLALALGYIVFHELIPRLFWRKCPRDGSILLRSETVVVPAQIHESGVGLAPILERTYACRRCDFRHSEAFGDHSDRANTPGTWLKVAIDPRANPPNSKYDYNPDRMLEDWEKLRQRQAITDAAYAQLLATAKAAARAKSASDSPWLRRS